MPPYRLYVDTEDGELCYDGVEIADDEIVGQFLDGIIRELQESGLTVAGSSAGDLRLIWNENELNLNATLAEQGVEPNGTLRILAETYEGGGLTLRQNLLESDLKMLEQLADLNPETLKILSVERKPLQEEVQVIICRTTGIEKIGTEGPIFRNEHRFRFVFPRFYPELAIACYCVDPLFHPNVTPESPWFFCLWAKFSSLENNLVQAVCRAQAAISLRIVNLGESHRLNRQATDWYLQQGKTKQELILPYKQLVTFRVTEKRIQWLDPNDTKNRSRLRRIPAIRR